MLGRTRPDRIIPILVASPREALLCCAALCALAFLLAVPPEIRKVTYTSNAIESTNFSLSKLTKRCSAFPSDEALMKLLYLALRNISRKWKTPIRDWKAALNRFAIQFEESMPQL